MSSNPPHTQPAPKLMFLKGAAYGLAQNTMVGQIQVKARRPDGFQRVQAFFRATLGEEAPPLPASSSPVEAWVTSLLHTQLLLQRVQKIPAFDPGRLLRQTAAQAGSQATVIFCAGYHRPGASKAALEASLALLTRLWGTGPMTDRDMNACREILNKCIRKLGQYSLGGTNGLHLLRAAHASGIPFDEVAPDVFSLGLGRHSRWLQSTMTEFTSNISARIAASKFWSASRLRQQGLPVPSHAFAPSAEKALAIAARLGYPVVVKPDDQEQGRGVRANLLDEKAVVAAFDNAAGFSRRVLVEKHCVGEDYRVTVYRDEIVKAIHRRPGGVTGDGRQTVAALIAELQATRRMQKHFRDKGVFPIQLDDEAKGLLAERGLDGHSVLPAGSCVPLRRKSNISAGGTQTLVPVDSIHPDNRDLAIEATQAIRLDLCGVDLILPDITRSWHETGGAIIELNAAPQIGIDLAPEVFDRILQKLLGDTWAIPAQLLICDDLPAVPDFEKLDALVRAQGVNGISSARGVWIDGNFVTRRVQGGFHAARILLGHQAVRSGLCVMTAEDVLRNGLPIRRFDRIDIMSRVDPGQPVPQPWHSVLSLIAGHGVVRHVTH